MEYKEFFKDSISRTLSLLKEYKGDYEITLLINSAYMIAGQIIERSKRDKNKMEEIYVLLSKYASIEFSFENKEIIVRNVRNSLAHYNIQVNSNGINYNKIDEIVLDNNGKYISFTSDNLKKFLEELGKWYINERIY